MDDITYDYAQYINKLGYNKDLMVIKEIKNIIKFIDTAKNKKIFIGGNGQSKITEITSKLF